jgi:hypothetical protein
MQAVRVMLVGRSTATNRSEGESSGHVHDRSEARNQQFAGPGSNAKCDRQEPQVTPEVGQDVRCTSPRKTREAATGQLTRPPHDAEATLPGRHETETMTRMAMPEAGMAVNTRTADAYATTRVAWCDSRSSIRMQRVVGAANPTLGLRGRARSPVRGRSFAALQKLLLDP